MKIEFIKKEQSRANKVYLFLEYTHGDGDVYQFKEIELIGITYQNYNKNLLKIEKEINVYQNLQELLHEYFSKISLGEKIADGLYGSKMLALFKDSPYDSTDMSNPGCKALLTGIKLIAYDETSNKYESNSLNYWESDGTKTK